MAALFIRTGVPAVQDLPVPAENWRDVITFRRALVALALTCVCWLTVALVPIPRAGGSPAAPTVGVVVFYAPTPLPILPGVALESFAADDLSRLLARSAPGRLTVIPSATMRRAEGEMRWRTDDALHFDRLLALAKAVGADRLVVGWIPLFSVSAGGGRSIPVPSDGADQPQAEVDIVAQVFDPSAGRLVAETRQTGFSLGVTTWQVSTQAVHAALGRSIPPLLRWLGGETP